MNDSEISERIRRDDENIESKTNHRWEVMRREERGRLEMVVGSIYGKMRGQRQMEIILV